MVIQSEENPLLSNTILKTAEFADIGIYLLCSFEEMFLSVSSHEDVG